MVLVADREPLRDRPKDEGRMHRLSVYLLVLQENSHPG